MSRSPVDIIHPKFLFHFFGLLSGAGICPDNNGVKGLAFFVYNKTAHHLAAETHSCHIGW